MASLNEFEINGYREISNSNEKTTMSLLHITYLLLTQHLFESSDIRKRLPFRIYSFCLERDIPLDTPLRNIEHVFPKSLHTEIGRSFLTDPRVSKMGLHGRRIPSKTFSDLSKFTAALKTRDFPRTEPNGQGLYHSFREMQETMNARLLPVHDLWLAKLKRRELVEHAWSQIRENEAIRVVCSPENTREIAKLVTQLLEVAVAGMPAGSVSETMVKTFINASVFADVILSKALMKEVFLCYEERFQSYLAFSIFYQAALADIVGPDLLIGLNKIGYLLGFQGSKSRPYISEFASKDGFEKPLFREYRIVEICSELQKADKLNYLMTRKNKGFDVYSPRSFSNPLRITQSIDGEVSIGRTTGYKLIDESLVPPGQTLLSKKQKNLVIPLGRNAFHHQEKDHSFEIAYLEPSIFQSQDFSGLFFLHSLEEKMDIFQNVVQVNSATKPNLSRKIYEHRRWGAPSSWLPRIDPTDLRACEAISSELNDSEERQRANRIFAEDWEMFEVPSSYTPGIVKLAGSLLAGEMRVEDCNFGPIEVDMKSGERRNRVICRVSRRQKTIERVMNHPLKMVQSQINLEYLDEGLTNFLPGTSPTIQSPTRFLPILQSDEAIVIANLDVKQCFDSLRWRPASFSNRMAYSRDFLSNNGFAEGADIHWNVLMEYFIGSLSQNSFKFYTKTNTFPLRGSLPTGFVLSPTLWHFLVLPLCFHLQEMKRQGKIFAWDLCGDDLMIVAPANISKTLKYEILRPWLDFAEDLELGFHFFKNYKDSMVPLHPSTKSLTFEDFIVHDSNADFVDQAWSKPWPRAAPFYHAGVALFGDQICVTPRLYYDPEASIDKIRRGRELRLCLAQSSHRRFGNQSQFLPTFLLRGFQLPELSTGALANLVIGAAKFEDKHISGSDQLALMLWGPRSPICRRQFDRKKAFNDPVYSSIMPNDFEINRLEKSGGKAVATRIDTVATGMYFFDGNPITKVTLAKLEKIEKKDDPIPYRIDDPIVGKTIISEENIENPVTAEELLASSSKQLVRYDKQGRPIFFKLVNGSSSVVPSLLFDDRKNVISKTYTFTEEDLLREIRIIKDRRAKEREELAKKKEVENQEKRVQRLAEKYPRYVKNWDIKKAQEALREWFVLCKETPKNSDLKKKVQDLETLVIKLSELEELAFLILQGAGGSHFSEEISAKESIVNRNEGRWIYVARKLMSNPKMLDKSKGKPLELALVRLPCLAFTLRHDLWSDVARAAFVHLTQEGGVVVPYFKGTKAKGVEVWRAGFFKKEWPRRVLRSMNSPYFPAEGDETEELNPINVKFLTTVQTTDLVDLCRKQKKLLNRYEKTFESHRKIYGNRDTTNQTAEAYSISRQEIDELIGILMGSGTLL